MTVMHVGNGFFIPERGQTPVNDINHAMVFDTDAEALKYATDNGWVTANQVTMNEMSRNIERSKQHTANRF